MSIWEVNLFCWGFTCSRHKKAEETKPMTFRTFFKESVNRDWKLNVVQKGILLVRHVIKCRSGTGTTHRPFTTPSLTIITSHSRSLSTSGSRAGEFHPSFGFNWSLFHTLQHVPLRTLWRRGSSLRPPAPPSTVNKNKLRVNDSSCVADTRTPVSVALRPRPPRTTFRWKQSHPSVHTQREM